MRSTDYQRLLPALAALLCAANAQAGVSMVGTGAPGGLSATDATTLSVQRGGGAGHVSLIPYFSTQGGNSTLINIVNMDTVNGKAVKVRFRGAGNGDTLSDFTLLLAAGDFWSTNVSSGSDGKSFLTVNDGSCTLPQMIANVPFGTDRLPATFTPAQKAEWTREGLVEVITMADIPRATEASLFSALTADARTLVHPCATTPAGAAAFDLLRADPSSEQAARRAGLDTPTTGVRASSILINVFGASISWSTPTTSMVWLNSAGVPGRGRLVFSPQTAKPAADADRFTNDPLLRSHAGGGAARLVPVQSDLPDLSTPYGGTAANAVDLPFRHTETIAASLKVAALRNEVLRNPDVSARTDWVISQPLRRYAVAVDHAAVPPVLAVNQAPAGPATYSLRSDEPVFNGRACSYLEMSFRDQHGVPRDLSFVITGISPFVSVCGNVSVMPLDQNGASVLKASVAVSKPSTFFLMGGSGYPDGHASLTVSRTPLPLIGAAYFSATGPVVANKSTNFGIAVNHDFIE